MVKIDIAPLVAKIEQGIAAHYSLPLTAFPFTIDYLSPVTREVLATITIVSPTVLAIPPMIDGPVIVRMTFADGDVVEKRPDSDEPG